MAYVEIVGLERCVLVVGEPFCDRWVKRGFVLESGQDATGAFFWAKRNATDELLRLIAKALRVDYGTYPPTRDELEVRIARELSRRSPRIQLFSKRVPRKSTGEPFTFVPFPSGPPRLDTEHYVVIEAVGADKKPVAGVQLELVFAGGEVRGAQTGADGMARAERIRAERVVIRVLNLDGSMWRPEDDEPAEESGSPNRVRWHEVRARRESLADIAKSYGLKDWRPIWNDPLVSLRERLLRGTP